QTYAVRSIPSGGCIRPRQRQGSRRAGAPFAGPPERRIDAKGDQDISLAQIDKILSCQNGERDRTSSASAHICRREFGYGSIAAESVKSDGAVCPLLIRLRLHFCS